MRACQEAKAGAAARGHKGAGQERLFATLPKIPERGHGKGLVTVGDEQGTLPHSSRRHSIKLLMGTMPRWQRNGPRNARLFASVSQRALNMA